MVGQERGCTGGLPDLASGVATLEVEDELPSLLGDSSKTTRLSLSLSLS
eukprot:COSAG03_NODE_6438_length_1060_cov_1.083247_1_plen_48_part_10